MTFTPLELVFGSSFLSLVVGLAVFFLTRSNFVSCRACKERHEVIGERLDRGERKFARIEEQVAALVTYNDAIPKPVKAKLVGPGGGE